MAERKLCPYTLRHVAQRLRKWSAHMLEPHQYSERAIGARTAENYWAAVFASEASALTRKPKRSGRDG